jgi:hypothetical protein
MRNTPNMNAEMAALPNGANSVTCPSGFGYTTGNQECRQVSLPLMTNNLFFQNRSFHIGVGKMGGGAASQQRVVTLYPTLDQGVVTGTCPSSGVADPDTQLAPNGSAAPVYWDLGVRGDTSQTPAQGYKLAPTYSILTSTAGYIDAGNPQHNIQPTNPATVVLAKYCNGARIPPEHCKPTSATTGVDPNDPMAALQCKGYQVPPGHSETTGAYPIFALNQIEPAATVDEGNNWINLSYGPLSLSNAASYKVKNTFLGPLGDYRINSGSPAASAAAAATSVTTHDFFGAPRPQGAGWDIGAVEIGDAGGGGGGGDSGIPSLTPLDNFNRQTALNLGANWTQPSFFTLAAIQVFDVTNGDFNTGVARTAFLGGNAYWGNNGGQAFGSKQAAAFAFSSTPVNNTALMLKATGNANNGTGLRQSFVRVLYTTAGTGTITVQTTTNGNANNVNYVTAGAAITGFGNFVAGDILTAQVDAAGVVSIWRTRPGTSVLLGTRQLPNTTAWTSGGGAIGMQLPNPGNNAPVRIDNFAGGTVP